MRLDVLKSEKIVDATLYAGWLVKTLDGSTPINTAPLSKSEAMAFAQAYVAEHGGPLDRYTKIGPKLGLKRLYKESRVENIKEADQQIMAKNRLKAVRHQGA